MITDPDSRPCSENRCDPDLPDRQANDPRRLVTRQVRNSHMTHNHHLKAVTRSSAVVCMSIPNRPTSMPSFHLSSP